MSWSFSVAPTARGDFDAAVDAAEVSGQDLALPGVADDVAVAKATLKELASRVKRDTIAGGAGGHSLQADEGPTWSDSLSVNAYGAS